MDLENVTVLTSSKKERTVGGAPGMEARCPGRGVLGRARGRTDPRDHSTFGAHRRDGEGGPVAD